MLNINLDKIPGDKFLTYIFVLFALIIPGFGYLYYNKFELFLDLELTKLLILSIFHSLPLFVSSIIIVNSGKIFEKDLEKLRKKKKDVNFKILLSASLFTILIFFLLLFISYITSQSLLMLMNTVSVGCIFAITLQGALNENKK